MIRILVVALLLIFSSGALPAQKDGKKSPVVQKKQVKQKVQKRVPKKKKKPAQPLPVKQVQPRVPKPAPQLPPQAPQKQVQKTDVPACPLEPCLGTLIISRGTVYKVGDITFARAQRHMAEEKAVVISRNHPDWDKTNVTYIDQISRRY